MSNLNFLGGNLSIANNALTSLAGMDMPDSIGGNLEIFQNDSLINLTGLDNITSIGGNLKIGSLLFYFPGNLSLQSLTGLDGLTSIGGDITINNNPVLDNIMGLNNLDASFITNLTISGNSSLSTCEAQIICNYLSSPGGTVRINNNAPGCNSLVEVAMSCGSPLSCLPDGIYNFSSQADIDNFQAYFPNCTELEGWYVIISGDDITNLNGLSEVTNIGGSLRIGDYNEGNPLLTDLTGLDNLDTIGGLRIQNNNTLTSVIGLGNVTTIGGLEIINNDALTSLTGLVNLSSIGYDLNIEGNSSLTSLVGLDGLLSLNNLKIEENDALTSLEGLTNLMSIGGKLEILDNDALPNLSGLDNITSIGDYLLIEGNPQLIDLSGLENLNGIQGEGLGIWDNEGLVSLSGLDNVKGETIDYLGISGNPSLSYCAVMSICDRLASSHSNVDIHDNAPGCNNEEEVEEACETVGVEESAVGGQRSAVRVYPNPTTGIFNLQFTVYNLQSVSIRIYDLFGQEMAAVGR